MFLNDVLSIINKFESKVFDINVTEKVIWKIIYTSWFESHHLCLISCCFSARIDINNISITLL